MTQYEMTEALAAKMNISLEDAKNALEANGWNTLTATYQLEQESFRRKQELNAYAASGEAAAVQVAPREDQSAAEEIAADRTEADAPKAAGAAEETRSARSVRHCRGKGLRRLADHGRRLVACGNRNRFEVRRGDEQVLSMPVTALVLLLLFAFWVCLPLLVIGLFAGFRYSFGGRELGRGDINGALDRAADAADRVRHGVAGA